MAYSRQLRYIEISRRNPISRILLGGSACNGGDVKITIRRAGNGKCAPKIKYNACCQAEEVPLCDTFVAEVSVLEIDDNGYAVFEWPAYLFEEKEGWYTGTITIGNSCSNCGEVPVRIGPRCNVVEVERIVVGPDMLCAVGCDDGCDNDVCPPKKPGIGSTTTIYIPPEI